jgi:hypothetical protein
MNPDDSPNTFIPLQVGRGSRLQAPPANPPQQYTQAQSPQQSTSQQWSPKPNSPPQGLPNSFQTQQYPPGSPLVSPYPPLSGAPTSSPNPQFTPWSQFPPYSSSYPQYVTITQYPASPSSTFRPRQSPRTTSSKLPRPTTSSMNPGTNPYPAASSRWLSNTLPKASPSVITLLIPGPTITMTERYTNLCAPCGADAVTTISFTDAQFTFGNGPIETPQSETAFQPSQSWDTPQPPLSSTATAVPTPSLSRRSESTWSTPTLAMSA